jgi:hypothetical protein
VIFNALLPATARLRRSRHQLVVGFLSKARWGGICRAVARSSAAVVAHRANARAQTPTRGRLRKGVGVSICTAEGVFPRDLSRGRMICRQRRKNTMIYHFLCVCTQVRCREDELKKLGDVVALPGGGGMPLRRLFN